jgi:hypothetical protein
VKKDKVLEAKSQGGATPSPVLSTSNDEHTSSDYSLPPPLHDPVKTDSSNTLTEEQEPVKMPISSTSDISTHICGSDDPNQHTSVSQQSSTVGLDWLFPEDTDSSSCGRNENPQALLVMIFFPPADNSFIHPQEMGSSSTITFDDTDDHMEDHNRKHSVIDIDVTSSDESVPAELKVKVLENPIQTSPRNICHRVSGRKLTSSISRR